MKPITFTEEMAAKVFNKQKTQTRRPINPQPECKELRKQNGYWLPFGIEGLKDSVGVRDRIKPEWQVGDVLYVQEDWKPALIGISAYNQQEGIIYESDDKDNITLRLKLDIDKDQWCEFYHNHVDVQPAIGMPYWASRTHLEVVKVWPERLKDISEADAIAEGVYKMSCGYWAGSPHKVQGTPRCFNTPQEALWDIWDSIYAKTEFKSANNPYVWVYEFKKI